MCGGVRARFSLDPTALEWVATVLYGYSSASRVVLASTFSTERRDVNCTAKYCIKHSKKFLYRKIQYCTVVF